MRYDGQTIPELLAWARSTESGQALMAAALAAHEGGTELRDGAALRTAYDPAQVAFAFGQAELRERGVAKFGADAASMWFTRVGLEQASSAAAAGHRAHRLAAPGSRVFDLCCGIGGDLVALARTRAHVTGVDRDPVHLAMALASCADLGLDAAGLEADVRDAPLAQADAVCIDPARRAGGRRVATGDGEPSLRWCFDVPVERVAVKAAPGLDRETLPPEWQVEFVADGRDLKESVLWSPAIRSGGAPALATVLTPGGASSMSDDGAGPAAVTDVGRWLLDPSPAIGRAGAVDALARRLGATKIDERIAFLTADAPMTTEFGRSLRVEAELPFDVRRLRVLLRERAVGAADLRRRGLAGDVDLIRKQLRLKGNRRVTLILTRVSDKPWAIVCVEPSDPPL